MSRDLSRTLSKIDINKFKERFYEVSIKQLAIEFNISNSTVNEIIKQFNLKKSKTQKQELRNKVLIEKYGSLENYYTNRNKKIKQTKSERYGDENYNNFQKGLESRFSKYESKEEYNKHFKETFENTIIQKYGDWETYAILHTNSVLDTIENRDPKEHAAIYQKVKDAWDLKSNEEIDEIVQKRKDSLIEKFGSLDKYKEYVYPKISETVQNKFGVPWACMREEARAYSGNYSKPNNYFAQLLEDNNIQYEREFILERYSFDFKINNILVEINPTITHNSTFSPFNKNSGIDSNYHFLKSRCAEKNNFRCIHVWDWDDMFKIIDLIKPKEKIYARNCILKEVSEEEINIFLNQYHLQNSCKNQDIRLGLEYNNKLVQVMTFGKPRYNKNYQWELLRLCSHSNYVIIGGAQKLYKYFIKKYTPKSIISYCDRSKFLGNIYLKLGFKTKNNYKAIKHWYNPNLHKHITDNLLRQRGFDQLLGNQFGKYGKGTSNEYLMKQHGFFEIYDCGQQVFTWKNT